MSFFWQPEHQLLDDPINQEIWNKSPAIQTAIQRPRSGTEGDVGALQALVGPEPLPWVPDLVGNRWKDGDSLIIVGSAYAAFAEPWAGRDRSMTESEFRACNTVDAFQKTFFRRVVAGDPNYYEPIAELAMDVGSSQNLALLDLCRASFVHLDDAYSASCTERTLLNNWELFARHVVANDDWTWRRLLISRTRRIVALGALAERGLLAFFHRRGATIHRSDTGSVWKPPRKEAGWVRPTSGQRKLDSWVDPEHGESWWVIRANDPNGRAREWRLLPVRHPSWRNAGIDSGYIYARRTLRTMLEARVADPIVAPPPRIASATRPTRRPSPAPAATAPNAQKASWDYVLTPRRPTPTGDLLALHPDAQAKTAELVDGLTVEQFIVMADAMFNRCRPSVMRKKVPGDPNGQAALAWAELYKGMQKVHHRPSGWTGAALLLLDNADSSLAQLHAMDIGELSAACSRLVTGPYGYANANKIR